MYIEVRMSAYVSKTCNYQITSIKREFFVKIYDFQNVNTFNTLLVVVIRIFWDSKIKTYNYEQNRI